MSSLKKMTLKERFCHYSREYAKSFPWVRSLVVVNTEEPIYISSSAAKILSDDTHTIQKIMEHGRKRFAESSSVKGFCRAAEKQESGQSYCSIILSTRSINLNAAPENAALMRETFTFDHEIGHLVSNAHSKNPYDKKEFLADSFASLMHIRRFGNKTQFLDKQIAKMSAFVVMPKEKSHVRYYSSYCLQAAIELSKEVDLKKCGLRDIDRLARRIVASFAPTKSQVFAAVHSYSGVETLGDVAKVMLGNKENEHVYRAGHLFLSSSKNREVINRELEQGSVFWKQAKGEIEIFEQSGLFNSNAVFAKSNGLETIKTIASERTKKAEIVAIDNAQIRNFASAASVGC